MGFRESGFEMGTFQAAAEEDSTKGLRQEAQAGFKWVS
jgi:hypothetical protein